jgi:hypothetical protein
MERGGGRKNASKDQAPEAFGETRRSDQIPPFLPVGLNSLQIVLSPLVAALI